MSTQNNNGLNSLKKWAVGAFLTALLTTACVMASRVYEGSNIAFALAPIVTNHTQKIETLEKDSQSSQIQNGIILNKLDLVLDELKELKKSKQ